MPTSRPSLGFLSKRDPFIGDLEPVVPVQSGYRPRCLLVTFSGRRAVAGHEVFFRFRRRHVCFCSERLPTEAALLNALPEAAAYLALRSKCLTISRTVSLDSRNSCAIALNVRPLHLRA